MTRKQQIAKLEEYGKFYNWDKYSDKQVWVMYDKYVLKNR